MTHVPRSVSVSVLDKLASPTKTDELIEMSFGDRLVWI